MNTKLKITLNEGLLEVEGSEEFVKEIYNDFKKNLLSNNIATGKLTKPKKAQSKTGQPTSSSLKTKTKSRRKSKTQSIVPDLNLRPKGKKSLDDFINGLNVKSNFERNVAFLYYLVHELKEEQIGLDHIYTCYRHLKAKVPAAFYQSIADTGAKGWIDTSDMSNLTLTSIGLNCVEHDLQATD